MSVSFTKVAIDVQVTTINSMDLKAIGIKSSYFFNWIRFFVNCRSDKNVHDSKRAQNNFEERGYGQNEFNTPQSKNHKCWNSNFFLQWQSFGNAFW
jgi:hypothetical protein